MEEFTPDKLRKCFLHRLSSWRRKLLLQEVKHLMPESLLLGTAAALAVPIFSDTVSPIGMAGIAVGIAVFLPLAGALRKYGSSAHCAREFDRRAKCNTRVLNAHELLCRGSESEFALFAVADGCTALETELRQSRPAYGRRTHLRRAVCAGILLVAGGAAILTGRRTEQSTCPAQADAIRSSYEQNSYHLPAVTPRPERPAYEFPLPGGENSGTVRLQHTQETPHRNADSSNQRRGSENNDAASAGRPGETGRQSPDEASAVDRESSGESGNAERVPIAAAPAEPVPTSALSAVTRSTGSGERSRRSSRKRPKRRNPESALGNTQPMLADNASPAGRELGEKEGDGEPDNGRGGPTGEKKARGSAAMLPVEPQPDTVDGTLAPGEEIRLTEHLPPPERTPFLNTAAAIVTSGGTEPVATTEIMSLAIRKEIIRQRRTKP